MSLQVLISKCLSSYLINLLASAYYTPEQLSGYYDQLISAGYMTKEQAQEALDQVFWIYYNFIIFTNKHLGEIPNKRRWSRSGDFRQKPKGR